MKQLLLLNDNYVDIQKVSFIGKVDNTINHHLTAATINYWFTVVVDGKDVRISGSSHAEAFALRSLLLSHIESLD